MSRCRKVTPIAHVRASVYLPLKNSHESKFKSKIHGCSGRCSAAISGGRRQKSYVVGVGKIWTRNISRIAGNLGIKYKSKMKLGRREGGRRLWVDLYWAVTKHK
jgi:hypothetical protein